MAKAMSVAAGIAQPRHKPGSLCVTARNTSAGTTMPAKAAMTGMALAARSASAPTSASRLISSPTSRKNTAINPSLIHASIVGSAAIGECSKSAWIAWT